MKRVQQFLFESATKHHRAGRLRQAEHDYREALGFDERDPVILNMLGVVLQQLGKSKEALEMLQRSLAVKATAEAQVNVGNVLGVMGRYGEAMAAYEAAVGMDGNFAAAHVNMAGLKERLGMHGEALRSYNRAIVLEPMNAGVHSGALSLLNLIASADREEVFDQHVRWGEAHAGRVPMGAGHGNGREPERKLRVGYVSAEMKDCAGAALIEPVLKGHDKGQVEVICYANGVYADAVTKRLSTHVSKLHLIGGMTDEQAAELVRKDGVDVLVDMTGHGAGGRLLMFARKPAPVQMSYLGYPNTTGLRAMDYRITDGVLDPVGETERFYTERLVRLELSPWSYLPPEGMPAVGELPALKNGYVTFGAVCAYARLNAGVMDVWCRVLETVRDSRLILRTEMTSPGPEGEGSMSGRVREMLKERGMDAGRVEFAKVGGEVKEAWELYGAIDILLDVFPWNGTVATLEALYMGVPVLTLKGMSHAGRMGASILTQAGMGEWAANSAKGYVRRSKIFTQDLNELARLRDQLRLQVQMSGLLYGDVVARELERVYREAWRAWCGG